MKRMLSLVVALGVAALFGSATLAGADCSYHQTQAAVSKPDTSKDVVVAPATDKASADQVKTAQVSQPTKPAAPDKK